MSKNKLNILKLREFNSLIEEFMEDLTDAYPENINFRVYQRGIEFCNQANLKKGYESFGYYVLPYENKIRERDESFFLETNDIKKELTTQKLEVDEQSIINMLHLKDLWINPKTPKSDKDCVWNYLNNLITLYKQV